METLEELHPNHKVAINNACCCLFVFYLAKNNETILKEGVLLFQTIEFSQVKSVTLTQLEAGAVCRLPAVQRTPEHIASLLVPGGLKRGANQQPGHTHTHTRTERMT